MLRWIAKKSLRRGINKNSSAWLSIGTFAVVLRAIGHVRERKTTILFRNQIQPGESLLVSHNREDSAEIK